MRCHLSGVHSIETVTELLGCRPQWVVPWDGRVSEDPVEFLDVLTDGIRDQSVVFRGLPGFPCLQVVQVEVHIVGIATC